MTRRTQLTYAMTYGLLGFILGIIACGYARAGTDDKCNAVTQAYTLAHNHYRSRTNLDSSGLYESEIAGIDLANDVSESYGVSCFIVPHTKKKGKANDGPDAYANRIIRALIATPEEENDEQR